MLQYNQLPTADRNFIRSIVLLPILFMYATPIPSFTVGDLYLIAATFYIFLNKKIKCHKALFLVVAYILFITALRFDQLLNPLTSLRYIVYLIIISMMPTVSKYKDYAFTLLQKSSYLAAILLIIQYILLITIGYCLPGVLTFLPLSDDSLEDYSFAVNSVNSGRCMSLFGEPSHFALFMLPYIAVGLFYSKQYDRKMLIKVTVSTVAIVLSSSFTGIMGAAMLWTIWLILAVRNRRISFKLFWGIMFIAAVVASIFFYSKAGTYVTDADVYERQSDGRFSGFIYLQEIINRMDTGILLFGGGMIDIAEVSYLSGWPRLFFYYGIIGSVIYVISFLTAARKKSLSMIFMLLIGVLMIGTEFNFGDYFLPYMLFVYMTRKSLYYDQN